MRSGAFSVDRRIPSRSRAQSNHDLKANVQRQTQTNTNKQLTPTPHEHPHVQHHTPPASSIVQRIFALFASCRRVFASLPCCVCVCVCGALPLSRSYPQATLIVRSFLCVSRTHSSIRSLPLSQRAPPLPIALLLLFLARVLRDINCCEHTCSCVRFACVSLSSTVTLSLVSYTTRPIFVATPPRTSTTRQQKATTRAVAASVARRLRHVDL